PKFRSDKAVLVTASMPAIQGGLLWMAVDQSIKDGPYDTLYIDANADGRLDDEKPIFAADQTAGESYRQSQFSDVKVLLPGPDGPTAYHVNVTWMQSQGVQPEVRLAAAGWYEGPVTVDGKSLWCVLVDYNVNGRFGDVVPKAREGDRIYLVPRAQARAFDWSDLKTMRVCGRFVEVEGKPFRLDVSPDGAWVRVSPPGEVPTGTVQLGKTVTSFSVVGPMGHFDRHTTDGSAAVPAGEYAIYTYEIARLDARGVTWRVQGGDQGTGDKPFGVEPGKAVAVNLGEPFRAVLDARPAGKGEYQINCSLQAAGGDHIRLIRNDDVAPPPQVRIRSAHGAIDQTYSLEYG
ncbi:MAG: hypothetical protein NT031_16525, partial [Planctomycetota bacterium]|nr:hypothetical protein [Planctomycetota bacterium]